jgi:MHS family proline/betaine transporter-like MFS transporter
MRPIGGMMMGYIGDKYGSRKALTISIFLMAFPTVSVILGDVHLALYWLSTH